MKKYLHGLTVALLTVMAPAAFAVADYSDITEAVDWSTVITGVISVFALVAGVYVAFKGGKLLIRAIRSA